MRPREKTALEYNATLKEKFAAHPQVKRIARHRQVPKHIYHERTQQLESRKKIKRKYVILLIKQNILLNFVFILIGKKMFADIQRKIVFRMFLKKRKMLFQKLNKLLFLLFILRFY